MADEPNQEQAPADPEPAAAPATPSSPTPVEPVDTGYTADGIPTFESVREKIETRYGTAIGATELAADTPEGRSVEKQYEERQRAAAERLEQIRESMRPGEDKPQ
jgi:phage shock protein A